MNAKGGARGFARSWTSFYGMLNWPELKSSMGQRSNQSNFWTSEFGQKFSQNSGNFVRIHQKFRNLRICQHFLNYSSKFWEILIEICAKFDENCWKNRDFYINFSKNMKKFDKNLRRFWVSSGAKVWESCRSRKTLQNEYLDAKIGVDTAENEPSKVWWFGWKIWEKFGIELFN